MNMREHLKQRSVDFDIHTVWVDDKENVATFPLWTLTGELAGYQAYRPESDKLKNNDTYGRYYKYVSHNHLRRKYARTVSVWGLESFDFTPDVLFVVEGIFDATPLTKRRVSAVAVMANDPNSSTKNLFRIFRSFRLVVVIGDPDTAGRKLLKLGHESHIVNVPGNSDADLGDSPNWYVDELIARYVGR